MVVILLACILGQLVLRVPSARVLTLLCAVVATKSALTARERPSWRASVKRSSRGRAVPVELLWAEVLWGGLSGDL